MPTCHEILTDYLRLDLWRGMMAAPIYEKTIVAGIISRLRRIPGCWAEKTHGERFGAQRLDITGCYKGRRFEVEVKRPGEKPTERQLATMQRWRDCGAVVACLHSVEEVEALVAQLHIPSSEA
jgi:hypothetical protein